MVSRPSSEAASPSDRGMKLKAFLTTVMSLLSILVFGLGCVRNDVLWSWTGFICALVSGIFVQMFLDRKKTIDATSGRRQ
jgi:hypothetical protein